MKTDSPEYWERRYLHKDTPWSLDRPHPAIVDFFKDFDARDVRILIPGAGYAYDAEWLWNSGFSKVFVCDWAETALGNFHQRVPDFPEQHLLHVNFFELRSSFDIILEHTFFCALPPNMRPQYAAQAASLLKKRDGGLAGVLFAEDLGPDGPPFGGTESGYRPLFERHFQKVTFKVIPEELSPRSVREIFFRAGQMLI